MAKTPPAPQGRRGARAAARTAPAPKTTKAAARRMETGPSFWQPQQLLWLALILLATAIVYSRTLDNGYVNWDDDVNVYDNANLELPLNAETTKRIFSRETGGVIGNYNPLPIFSFAVEKALFDLDLSNPDDVRAPRVLHTTNMLLHLLCVVLIFRLMQMLNLSLIATLIATALFALHPMRVESVAWITERKDVLFGVFYIGALLTYLQYLRKTEAVRWMWLGLTLLLGLVALFAKIQAVALPLSMLVIDYLYRRPLVKPAVWLEKIPFFILSLVFGLIGIQMLEDFGSIQNAANYSFGERILVGLYSYVVYVFKLFIPWEMAPLYPYPNKLGWEFYAAPLPFLMMLGATLYAMRREWRWIAFGMGFFTFNVMFVLQVVGAGQGFIADRFTYIPYIGLFYLLGAAYDVWVKERPALRTAALGAGAAFILLMTGLTWRQIGFWKDGGTLWSHVISLIEKQDDKAVLPYTQRAFWFREHKQYDKALLDYNTAARLDPNRKETFNSRAKLYFDTGRLDEAIVDYKRAIQLDSTDAEYWINLGAAYGLLGDQAIQKQDMQRASEFKSQSLYHLDKGITRKPDHFNGLLNRSLILRGMGQFDKAIQDYDAYLKLRPGHADIWYERGASNNALGRWDDALKDFNKAIQLNPNGKNSQLYYAERARSHMYKGNTAQALEDARRAQRAKAQLTPDLESFLQQQAANP